MTDLTKIKTPYGILLDEQPEVAKALRECGGPWEEIGLYDGVWKGMDAEPKWTVKGLTYRQKPQPPKPREFWIVGGYVFSDKKSAEYRDNFGGGIIHVREVMPE